MEKNFDLYSNKPLTLNIELKANRWIFFVDFAIRNVILLSYVNDSFGTIAFWIYNIILLALEFSILLSWATKVEKKVKLRIRPEYKDRFKKIVVSSTPSNSFLAFSMIGSILASFLYTYHWIHYQSWYYFIFYTFLALIFMFAALILSFLTGTALKPKIESYKISYTVSDKPGSKLLRVVDITRGLPNVLQDTTGQQLTSVELDEVDKNDIEISKIESDLKSINNKVDAYMLESVLLGGLAFSGFLTVVSSNIINADTHFNQIFSPAFRSVIDSCTTRHLIHTECIATFFADKNCLLLVIIFESLLCSVFFLLVLMLRLRYTALGLKMDYMIGIMNIFNAKEEELTTIRMEHSTALPHIEARLQKLSKKIDVALTDASNLLKEINPIINLMSFYRNVGITLFYLILTTSGLYFSPLLSFIIIFLLLFTVAFRFIDAQLKLDRINGILKRH